MDTEYVVTLPEGYYACYMTHVVQDSADFTALLQWLQEHKIKPQFVVADEVGLQLFEYLEHGYPCEVKVFLGETMKCD